MDKVNRDGLIAVIYSPGFGAGWYSWHGIEALLFDPNVVGMIEDGADPYEIEKYCERRYGTDHYFSCDDLAIAWIPEGTEFMIHEYDGSERLRFRSEMRWSVA